MTEIIKLACMRKRAFQNTFSIFERWGEKTKTKTKTRRGTVLRAITMRIERQHRSRTSKPHLQGQKLWFTELSFSLSTKMGIKPQNPKVPCTMSTASINSWCLTSVSASKRSLPALRPSVFASLNSSVSPPTLIRNQPVFAAPAPILYPPRVQYNASCMHILLTIIY